MDLVRNFKNENTRNILAKMVGTLTPGEISDVIEDKEVAKTDLPKWVELVLQEKCKTVLNRLTLYENRYYEKYGLVQHTIQKLSVYHLMWTNWDGLEPCPFYSAQPLHCFFDENLSANME